MQCKCTWKGIGKRAGIILAVSAVSVSAIYFGGMRIRQAVTTMTAPKKETPVIVLDAGHGGADGGCVSVNAVPEKGINLNILLSLRDFLRMEGYTEQEIADKVGYKTASAVHKRIAKIADAYEDFVAAEYGKYLDR